jgi:3-methyladenine DNA glycosylase/8-oxoguanine DNA glycosylase
MWARGHRRNISGDAGCGAVVAHMKLSLSARPPFNFHSVIHSHGWYQLAPLTWDKERGMLGKPERLDSGRVVSLTIQGDHDGVHVETQSKLNKREQTELTEKVRWMFALDADFTEFYALADAEPRLAHVRGQALGRYLRSTTVWEDVVRVMMTTNIQWGGTKRLVASLVNHFGEPCDDEATMRAFPIPEKIARSRETTLRKLGLGYRSPYLLQLARGVVSGQYALEALKDGTHDTDDVRQQLLALPGIGPYAAATLLGILGRYDYIGVDTEAISNVSKGFYGGKPVGAKEVDAVFAKWGKYKSLAYWFWDWEGQQQTPMEAYEKRVNG